MAENNQLAGIIEKHLPGSLTNDQKSVVAPGIAELVSRLLSLNILTPGLIAQVITTSLLRNVLFNFQLDFTDINQLIEEILRKLKDR